MRKFLIVLSLFSTSFFFISCSNKDITSNIPNEPLDEIIDVIPELEEKTYTEFKALGNFYTSTDDINNLEPGDVICDDQVNNSYVKGQYKELDFSYDVLNYYLNENENFFENLVSFDTTSEDKFIPITEEDKNKLITNLNSLRSQMELTPSQEMIVKLDKVIYEGISYETESGVTLKIRVAISRSSDYLAAWNYFTLTVYEKDDILYCNLF